MTSDNARLSGARFDVRDFARTARGNHRESLPLESFADAPLSDESLHAIRYLGRLESATMEQLRNLLVTATHKDARVTAFLVTWSFEKFWIADALDAVLEAHGRPKAQEVEEGAPRNSRSEARERRGPIRRAISAIRQGVPIIAVHVTMGLVDEWVTRAAYERLADASNSAPLRQIVTTILDVKQRHADFFEDDARRRLAESDSAVKQTRATLVQTAWPIGAVDRAADDRTFFESYVFGGGEGAARADTIGKAVASLPGLDNQIGTTISRNLLA
ncbi:MAG: hypothetical protein JWQ43_3214 [Glaciihabitans sp.]|nr:hypothetical protein [Glaciihabitans sp.]